jgi:hypothetical protein
MVIMQPSSPIFVIEGLDIHVYNSIDETLRALEPIDVRNNEYSVYDRDGRRLELRVARTRFWGHEKVVLDNVETEPTHAAELGNQLASFLAYSGVEPEWLDSASLPQLEKKTQELITSRQ